MVGKSTNRENAHPVRASLDKVLENLFKKGSYWNTLKGHPAVVVVVTLYYCT